MIKKAALLFSFLISGVMIVGVFNQPAHSYSSGAPEGHTGSPGDGGDCTSGGCHGFNPGVPTGNEVVEITSDIPVSGYVPGALYNITATATDSSVGKFGFQVSPQDVTGNVLGTLIAGPETILVGLNAYMTHTYTSNLGMGTRSWTFRWTAPTVGTGEVVFYGAFNFTNNNSSMSGDVIVTTNVAFAEDITVGVETAALPSNIQVFPNPVSERINVSLLENDENTSYQLLDIQGNIVLSGVFLSAGLNTIVLDRKQVLSGLYVLRFNNGKHASVSKLLIK